NFAAVLRENSALQQALEQAAPDAMQAELRKVWIASDYAAGLFLTDPALVLDLLQSGDLTRDYRNWGSHLRDFLARHPITETDPQARLRRELRQYRKREWLRILWRDVTERASVMDTCRDLSLLADACINYALEPLSEL